MSCKYSQFADEKRSLAQENKDETYDLKSTAIREE